METAAGTLSLSLSPSQQEAHHWHGQISYLDFV
jgi:hypothetical protein